MIRVTADQLRADMVGILNRSLDAMPGETKGQKVGLLASFFGMKPRRIDDYRWGLEIQPSAEEYVNLLKRAETIHALEAGQVAILREIETLRQRHAISHSPSAARMVLQEYAAGSGRSAADRIDVAPPGIDPVEGRSQADRSRELLTLCGSVELVETLPLSAACDAHIRAIRIAEEAGGFLTQPVVDHLHRTGLAPMTSVFGAGDQLPLLSMGSQTRFWSDEQRQRMTGAPFDAIPAPFEFKRVVAAQLADVRASAKPALTRIIATCGDLTVHYRTLRVFDRATGYLLAFPHIANDGALGAAA